LLAPLALTLAIRAEDLPGSFYSFSKNRHFVQTSPAAPVAIPNTPVSIDVDFSRSAGSVRLPSGTVRTVAVDQNIGIPFASQAALDAAFPPPKRAAPLDMT